ncbi:hypothetical protein DXX75_027890 [Escherichia coli]|nr:hypothetical protein DXX75_027890 [Escherichia coli]
MGVTAKQFVSELNALGDITHINLHINSPGGDVFEGIAIFNALKIRGDHYRVCGWRCRLDGICDCDGR